jgi:hypothetical protein
MNRNIEGETIDAINDVEDVSFHTPSYLSVEIVQELVARKLLVGEIDGKDTLALEKIKERHKARLEAEKDGVVGGVREDFEVVRLLGIIDKLMRSE